MANSKMSPNRSTRPGRTMRPKTNTRSKFLVPTIIILGVLCILAAVAAIALYFMWPRTPEARPIVMIHSPDYGEQLEISQPTTIHIISRDDEKISRVELWVDDQLFEVQESVRPTGTSPLPLVLAWAPDKPGNHTLVARAYNTKGVRGQATVIVEAVESLALLDNIPADSDDDGIADEIDECPEVIGLAPDGCPPYADMDNDTVPDEIDDCPEIPGTPAAEGCPDADGDSVPDEIDTCPDVPGAPEDGCPSGEANDRDGDGISDSVDACPDEAGIAEEDGCPPADEGGGVPGGGDPWDEGPFDDDLEEDSDDDGVPDSEDDCPVEPGTPERDGCPETAEEDGTDSDGDGVPDDEDTCPEDPGLPEDDGCPAPGAEEDADGDGIPDTDEDEDDDILPDVPGAIMHLIEFQALNFETSDELDQVYCYAQLNQAPMEHIGPLDPVEDNYWDISEDLGSRMVSVDPNADMRVFVECYGYVGLLGLREFMYLGYIEVMHPPTDWDGHVIHGQSEVSLSGIDFEGDYRICDNGCDNAAFPPPYIFDQNIAGQKYLIWTWLGDYRNIDGFKVYINDSLQLATHNDTNMVNIERYAPACGVRYEFEITAFDGPNETPRSNTFVWEGEPCAKKVLITFESLNTFDLRDENRHNTLGPIFGSFYASGSSSESLSFQGSDYPDGLMLHRDSTHSILSLFQWINNESMFCSGGSSCPFYHAPGTNFVEVEIGPDDDLSIGSAIYEMDRRMYNTVFNARDTFAYDEIEPGRYTIRDREVELVYWIDVLVAAETGDAPDLVITGVSQHGTHDQLRIHIFNNGGSLANQDITIQLHDSVSGELVFEQTWTNVTITTGETRLLQDSRTDIAPYGITATIDPYDSISESNEENNVFETPVLMQVQLTKLFIGSPCESFLNNDSEHWFRFYVGHGPALHETTWVANGVRYPASGVVILERYQGWGESVPEENFYWHPADEDARFTVEVPVPPGERLYIKMAAYEDDAFAYDFMGYINANYGPEENYGHREDSYHADSTGPGTETCNEGTHVGWDYFGFRGWWKITRLH
ncbi:MAG: thrombospondin type 3 repeat-containing protein [Anaerolineaceae bacterium]|nr:thrombospondin type 3 repeat-containing protein [Anaerolineaceae bacterium]